jgi:hypothetical protein
MNRQPETTVEDTTLKTLQLLLRCGMVSREELNIVLETMTVSSSRRSARLHLVDPPRQNSSNRRISRLQSHQSTEALQLPAGIVKTQSPQNQFAFGLD